MSNPSAEESLQAPPSATPAPSQARQALRALVSHKLALVCLVILGVVVLTAIFGKLIAPYEINATDVQDRFQGPSGDHLFGTDDLGRDIFSRVVVAASVSIRVSVVAVAISLALGVTIGLLAGYYGRFVDDALMRVMDMFFAFPAVLLALAILAVRGPSLWNAMIAIGIVYMPIFARVTRASVLSVREEVFVRASRSIGAGDARIIGTHILPNALGPIIVQTSLSLAFAILSEAALSFLGLGVQPPTPSWGRMLYDAKNFIDQGWWMALFPGLAIFVTVLSFNIVGDALRDALDPAQRSAIEARRAG